MLKKLIVCCLLLVSTVGCMSKGDIRSFGNNEAYVIDPEGNKYLVSMRKDAIVHFKKGDVEFSLDNRGREGIVEGVMKIYAVSALNEKD